MKLYYVSLIFHYTKKKKKKYEKFRGPFEHEALWIQIQEFLFHRTTATGHSWP